MNLWGHLLLPKINLAFARACFCTLSDLPLTVENKIDFLTVQNKIQSSWFCMDIWHFLQRHELAFVDHKLYYI